ncbi:MFS transporter [bacterium]|nr:MFS transporter [bacterium]MBU1983907.1 MFS transporter [bacterium]
MAQEINQVYRRVRATVWLPLGFMYASYYMTRYNLSFGKTTMTREFGWTNEQWGWIGATFFWMYAFGQFINGQITDRIGGRKAIVIGAVATVILNCLMALGGGFGVIGYFIIMWGANGYFQAFGAPSIVSVNGNWFALRERGTFTGIFGMMIQLGRFAVTLLGGFLIANYAWPNLFIMPALITAFFAIIAWFAIRNHPEDIGFEAPDMGEHDQGTDHRPAGIRYTLKKVLSSPTLWVISMAYFCTGWVRHGFEQWFPAYLQEVQHLAPDSMAFQLKSLALPVTAVLGAFAAGVSSDKLFGSRRGPPAAIMYYAQFVLLIIFYYYAGPTSAAVLLILLSFFVNGPHSLLGGAAAMDFGGRKASGSAAGMIDAFQYIGAGIVQPIVGSVIDVYGWNGWALSLAGFALIGGILMSTLWNAKPK